jgi:hypothetical protein
MMMEVVGSSWLVVVDKSPEEHKAAQEAAEKVRKEALADMSNCHHAWTYKKQGGIDGSDQ